MRKILCILALCCLTLSLMAQGDRPLKQRIGQAAAAVKTLQCDFVQTKHMKMLNHDMVSKGKMYYQQPACLRWEYTTPYAYTFILNNDKVLLKNAKRNDVIDVKQNKMFREIAHIMLNSVVGSSLTDDKNFRSTITTAGGEWVATLLPQSREMKQMFSKIVLHISQKVAVVTQVELIEKSGDKTVIDLKNIKTNETISADMFAVR